MTVFRNMISIVMSKRTNLVFSFHSLQNSFSGAGIVNNTTYMQKRIALIWLLAFIKIDCISVKKKFVWNFWISFQTSTCTEETKLFIKISIYAQFVNIFTPCFNCQKPLHSAFEVQFSKKISSIRLNIFCITENNT